MSSGTETYVKVSGNERNGNRNNTPPVNHHFLLSLLSVICCCQMTGIVALAYSLKSSAKADVHLEEKARLYSNRARLWSIISIGLGILLCVLYFIYGILVAVAVNKLAIDNRHSLENLSTT